MSQRDLERTSGIPKSRISRYENGHLLPSLAGLQKLSTSLGIPDSTLLTDTDDVYSVFVLALRRLGVSFANLREAEVAADRVAAELLGEVSPELRMARDPRP